MDDAEGSTAEGGDRNPGSRLAMTATGTASPVVDFANHASGHISNQQAYPAIKKATGVAKNPRRWEKMKRKDDAEDDDVATASDDPIWAEDWAILPRQAVGPTTDSGRAAVASSGSLSPTLAFRQQ